MPTDETILYAELEAGARYLAAETGCADERTLHLGMADDYAARRRAALRWGSN